jgi:hypothetical protein
MNVDGLDQLSILVLRRTNFLQTKSNAFFFLLLLYLLAQSSHQDSFGCFFLNQKQMLSYVVLRPVHQITNKTSWKIGLDCSHNNDKKIGVRPQRLAHFLGKPPIVKGILMLNVQKLFRTVFFLKKKTHTHTHPPKTNKVGLLFHLLIACLCTSNIFCTSRTPLQHRDN